ncbi:uncharacterized protein LOC135465769 [Liolophura sinensis]|uniref:uncharacterized protein LOC135465769 n=1 Tax=Liolophura sinensis TaxID=3198878 RepID=UPI0031580C32
MANLKSSLDSYLARSSDSLQSSSTTSSTKHWFSFSRPEREEQIPLEGENGWFSQAQEDPCLPSLTKKQRIVGFVLSLLVGSFCFSLAGLYIPILMFKARKFACLYTLGSVFFIMSFSFLWGPTNHVKHLISAKNMPFTVIYFGTLFGTLYFSLWWKSTGLTIIFAVLQIGALVLYITSYIPGGQTGIKFFSRIFYATASKTISKTLPV